MPTMQSATSTASSYIPLDPAAPSPEKSPADYSHSKVEERLEYVHRAEERNLTPRSQMFLQLYKEAADNALQVVDEDVRACYYTRLYRYDQFIQQNFWLCKEPTEQHKELEQKLLELKRLEYYARYGDHLTSELAEVKETARALRIESHEELQDYWTKINEKMRDEKLILERDGVQTDHRSVPTLLAVWHVANTVNLPRERVIWVIEQYAQRSLLSHYTITQLMQTGDWSALAILLYNDAKDLAVTIPLSDARNLVNMSATISTLKERFFEVEPGDEDFPKAWTRTESARDYRNELRTKLKAGEEREANLIEAMTIQASKAMKKREKRSQLVEKAILRQRKASELFPLGEAILDTRTMEMEKVVGIQSQVDRREQEPDQLHEKRTKAVNALGDLDIKDDSFEEEDGEGGKKTSAASESNSFRAIV